MAKYSYGVIRGLAMFYEKNGGQLKLEEDIAHVAQELVDGVTITSLNYEAGGGSGKANRSPDEMMELLVAVNDYLQGQVAASNAVGNFRETPTRT